MGRLVRKADHARRRSRKLLKPYRIKTMPVWVDGQTVRGYKREQFADAWLRVLGVRER